MKQGDVVQLGRHRLMCGDATNLEHVNSLVGDAKPDMLYCDPPFGIRFNADHRVNYEPSEKAKAKAIARGINPGTKFKSNVFIGWQDEKPLDFSSIFMRFARVAEQFWWGADNYVTQLPNAEKGSWVVWDKRVEERFDRIFGSQMELCWSKKPHRYMIARVLFAGMQGMVGIDKRRHHPTQKPVPLAEWFLERFSKADDIVLDLFGGSGSTLLACERMNRCCYMMEIRPEFCQAIIERYEQLAQQPKLLEVS